MKILYIGDVTGKMGRAAMTRFLPDVVSKHQPDLVIAQSENTTHGKGITTAHLNELQKLGVDVFTGGNHSLHIPATYQDETLPITRPANLVGEIPGRGSLVYKTAFGDVLVVSLQGQIVGFHQAEISNPLEAIDEILASHSHQKLAATIVNFHGDYSSEKVVIGQYLDGRVSAVIGDHWHVPTADAQVLPGGTAHISDVGMVGALDSSLGVKTDVIVKRWQTNLPSRNEMEETGRLQFNAVLVDVDTASGHAKSIDQIRIIAQP